MGNFENYMGRFGGDMKLTREYVIKEISEALNLPPGRTTIGYFTKKQLIRLFFLIRDHAKLKEAYDALKQETVHGKQS